MHGTDRAINRTTRGQSPVAPPSEALAIPVSVTRSHAAETNQRATLGVPVVRDGREDAHNWARRELNGVLRARRKINHRVTSRAYRMRDL